MKRVLIGLLLLMWSISSAQREAYVANSLAETLSLIDLETGEVTNHITLLGEVPNQVAYHDDYLYAVNSISADVYRIDLFTHQIVDNILLPVGSNPYYITFQGDYGFVTGWVSGAIYRIDLVAGEVDREVYVGGFPEGIIYVDGYLYVTKTNFNPDDWSYGQGEIAVVDAGEFTIESTNDVGTNPQWISRAPDGNLHIVCTGNYVDIEGSIYIFDTVAGIVSDSILIGGQPAILAISPGGIGYLSAGGWFDYGHLFSYDIFSGEILRGPSNPINVGLGATWVAVDSLGFIYSCNFGDDTVMRLNPQGEILETFSLGDGPVSMVVIDDAIIGIESDETVGLPEKKALLENYPNPFNAGTVIRFEIPEGDFSSPAIEIYDITGRLVKTKNFETSAGSGSVYWDGTGVDNVECASGVYFGRLLSRSNSAKARMPGKTMKMTILR